MDLQAVESLNADLTEFAGDVFKFLPYAGQRGYGVLYLRGLLLDGKRKPVEPMAERLGVPRQNLGHFVGQSSWQYTEVVRRVAARAVRVLSPTAWLIDDHPFVRHGRDTAGAARQHCGERGLHLCRVAVSVHATSPRGSVPLHWRLFLPEAWAADRARCAKAGVPPELGHRTKSRIAVELLDELRSWGQSPPLVIADAAYGVSVPFRAAPAERDIRFLTAVNQDTTVSASTAVPAAAWSRRRDDTKVNTVAEASRHRAHRFVYRKKTAFHPARSGWFAAMRVHFPGWPERKHQKENTTEQLLPERTLLVQCKHKRGGEVFRSWITDLPADTPLSTLVRHATSRWHIETDYREREQALGLGDYEGRGYDGFHRHIALVSAAHLLLPGSAPQPKRPTYELTLYQVVTLLQVALVGALWRCPACHRTNQHDPQQGQGP